MNTPLTVGTTSTISAALPAGPPPSAVTMWATPDVRGAPVSIPCSVSDGKLVGTWTPRQPGTWTIAAAITAPYELTGTTRVVVNALPRRPAS